MSGSNTYLAVFLGSKTSPRMTEWMAAPEAERKRREQEGVASWHGWVEKHRFSIVEMGGPLGKTKRASSAGIEDVSNPMGAFCVVRAVSHEAAAKIFVGHPHFTQFPGDAVEVMPILPVPGA